MPGKWTNVVHTPAPTGRKEAAVDHSQYSVAATEDIVRLRRRIALAGLPPRRTDANVIVGTWNIQKFGGMHPHWSENAGSPKRNLRALALLPR